MATAILADMSRLQRTGLRCGVFICGRPPFDAGSRYSHTSANPMFEGGLDLKIDIPTAHIWGGKDQIEPGQGLALSELCRPELRQGHIHGGGHEVPGARHKDDLVESANAIRRMLAQL